MELLFVLDFILFGLFSLPALSFSFSLSLFPYTLSLFLFLFRSISSLSHFHSHSYTSSSLFEWFVSVHFFLFSLVPLSSLLNTLTLNTFAMSIRVATLLYFYLALCVNNFLFELLPQLPAPLTFRPSLLQLSSWWYCNQKFSRCNQRSEK